MSQEYNKFFKPALINRVDSLNSPVFEEDTGYVIFCNENDAIYVKLDGRTAKRYGGLNPINHLNSSSEEKPLAASMGKVLKEFIDEINSDLTNIHATSVTYEEIVDDLDHTDSNIPLSANQGNILNQKVTALETNKVNISDIVDSLDSTESNKPLSSKQGNILNNKIDSVNNKVDDLNTSTTTEFTNVNTLIQHLTDSKINYTDIINDLLHEDVLDKPLSAGMGAEIYKQLLEILETLKTIPSVLDTLTSNDSENALSANQGRILNEKIEALDAGFYGKVISVREKETVNGLEVIEISDNTISLPYIYTGPYVTEIDDTGEIAYDGDQVITLIAGNLPIGYDYLDPNIFDLDDNTEYQNSEIKIVEGVLADGYNYIDPDITDISDGSNYPNSEIEVVDIEINYEENGITILDSFFSIITNNSINNLGDQSVTRVREIETPSMDELTSLTNYFTIINSDGSVSSSGNSTVTSVGLEMLSTNSIENDGIVLIDLSAQTII